MRLNSRKTRKQRFLFETLWQGKLLDSMFFIGNIFEIVQ